MLLKNMFNVINVFYTILAVSEISSNFAVK